MAAREARQFERDHLFGFTPQPKQLCERDFDPDNAIWELASSEPGLAYSVFEKGSVIAVGGVLPIWHGRGHLWSMLSDRIGPPQMLFAHRFTRSFIIDIQRQSRFNRLEIHVRTSFAEAHRWAKMLGFTAEGNMRAFDPLGHDCTLYARIKTCLNPSASDSQSPRPAAL